MNSHAGFHHDLPSGAHLIRSDLTDPKAEPLLRGLHQEYLTRYGPQDELSVYPTDAFTPPRGTAVLLTLEGTVVAGGALRILEPGLGEIKRMWTHPHHRRLGFARTVLGWLHQQATIMGCDHVRLETGNRQPEAVALYRSQGYTPIEGYGHHQNNPDSLSLQRHLP